MTVSDEELEAEGYSIEEFIAHWEYENKWMQQHKFFQHFQLTSDTLQQWWSIKDLHEFCLKACAIYATVEIPFERELAEYLWNKWFRQGKTPCRFGNFFARFVGSYNPGSPKTIPELLDAHQRICAQVLLRQGTLCPQDEKPAPLRVDDRLDDPYENHENYILNPIFHAVFIVLDTTVPLGPSPGTWRSRAQDDPDFAADTPVLLVRTGVYHDLRTGPIDFASIEVTSEMVDGNENVRRITLCGAVGFVLDLQRRNAETHT
ncbi:MAG: hypothetical protein LQ351_004092 [Letrouitia transgressa]|nr:MAG: hypothetical protein LQ351_004092 [Letrouitia transgressa]